MTPGLLLRCGCVVAYVEGETPVCDEHGRRGVARAVNMPKPRIRGMASGPLVRTMDLEPFVGRIAGSAAPAAVEKD